MQNRRQFLLQSFAFSALASLHSLPSLAAAPKNAKPSQDARHLLVVGDWGYENPTAQISVARAMTGYARQHSLKTEALLMLGDSWYGPLDGGVDCPRWKTNFEDAYPQSVFDCPAYTIPGNHDYQILPINKLQAELDYAKRPGTRWTMPSLWYRVELPAKNPVMTLIALDSNVPHPDGSKPKAPNFTLTAEQQAQQLAWLQAELEKPLTTPFLAVMAHHPIFSNGPHGDHKVLMADWEPLLRKHNVHLFMAGHDHDLQHLEFASHPTSFFLSGGGADLYNIKIDEAQRGPFAEKAYGFSHIEMTHDNLLLRHLDENGKVVHAFTKQADHSVQILSA